MKKRAEETVTLKYVELGKISLRARPPERIIASLVLRV